MVQPINPPPMTRALFVDFTEVHHENKIQNDTRRSKSYTIYAKKKITTSINRAFFATDLVEEMALAWRARELWKI